MKDLPRVPGGLGGRAGAECGGAGTSVPGRRLTDGRGAGTQAPSGTAVSSGRAEPHAPAGHGRLAQIPSTDQPCLDVFAMLHLRRPASTPAPSAYSQQLDSGDTPFPSPPDGSVRPLIHAQKARALMFRAAAAKDDLPSLQLVRPND